MTSLVKPKPIKIRVKKPMLVGLALSWLLTIDFLTRISAGPLSLSGALTLAGAALCLVLAPMMGLARSQDRREQVHKAVPLALTLFVLYALGRLLITPSSEGLQNVAVYTTFVLAVGLTSIRITSEASVGVLRWMRYIAVIVTLVFLVTFLAGVEVYGERAFALTGLIFLAVLIPHKPRNRFYRLAPFLVAGVIALSLSRTATAIALVMLIFLSVRGKKGFRFLASLVFGVLAAALAYWLINYYAPLRDRFIGGDAGASLGNVEVNTSGRTVLWDMTLRSAEQDPLFGNGPGTATAMISASFRNISHPHNEYLRLFHDFGYVGAILFVLGTLTLLFRTLRRVQHSDNPIHWAASLGIMALFGAALTDNVIIYPFFMVPLGVIVGASIGLPVEARMPKEMVTKHPLISPAYKQLLEAQIKGR